MPIKNELGSAFLNKVDRLEHWTRFPGLKSCTHCKAGCCTLPVEVSLADLIRLELIDETQASGPPKRIYNLLSKQNLLQSYNPRTGIFVLAQSPERDCIYLDRNSRKCTVYEKRPTVCREFPKIGPKPGSCPYQPLSR